MDRVKGGRHVREEERRALALLLQDIGIEAHSKRPVVASAPEQSAKLRSASGRFQARDQASPPELV
eukprot:11809124-Alexandrium_andersonii.AAC.1